MNATLTKAVNAIKSTIKPAMGGAKTLGGWTKNAGSQMGSTIGGGFGDWRRGASALDAAKGVGRGLGQQWKHGDNAARIGMGTATAATGLGGMAAADFLNPWGLGWGD